MSDATELTELLDAVTKAAVAAGGPRGAVAAGDRLQAEFPPAARPASRADMAAAGHHLEDLVLGELRPTPAGLRPQAGGAGDELETTPLPPGEWWVVDAVEGAVNYVHGLPEWAVTVALLRDGQPVLTVVRQPEGDRTWTATRGGGAHLNGQRLQVSAKTSLDAAAVVTGQAEAGQQGTHPPPGPAGTPPLGPAPP